MLFDNALRIFQMLTDPSLWPLIISGGGRIVLLWGLLALGIVGTGRMLLLWTAPRTARAWLMAGWLGGAVFVALSTWVTLFGPSGMLPLTLIIAVGIIGLTLDALQSSQRWHPTRADLPWLVAAVIAVMLVANASTLAPINSDAALYHLQKIEWLNAYGAVPGLGNIHGRLAFNSTIHNYYAALDVGLWAGESSHVGLGLLWFGVAVGALLGARAMLVHAPRVHHLFDLLTIPLLVWSIAGRRGAMPLGTPLNDTFVFFIGFVCTSLLIELLDDTEDPPPYVVPTLTVLSVLGVTFKLSFAAFALVVAGLLLWRNPRQTLAWGVGATALLAVPWLAHGVVTSGYPAFPTVLGAFPVDWIVPCFAANDEATWVYSWARQPFGDPAEVLSGWAWLRPWIVQTFSQDMLIVTPALVTGVGVATALVGCVKVRRWWWAAAPHIATLIFWFFSAPDPRFLGATPWSLAILTIMAASEPLRQ